MQVICSCAGDPEPPGDARRHHLDDERLLQMYHVGPFDGLLDYLEIGLCELIPVRLDQPVENGNPEILQLSG